MLDAAERRQLEAWARNRSTSQGLALRARIVLGCAEGQDNKDVAVALETSQQTVSKWRNRFLAGRLEGLLDAPRSGAPRTINEDRIDEVLNRTLESAPADMRRWSTRSMAREVGISATAVGRIWRSFGVQPQKHATFPLLDDAVLVGRTLDVFGLYVGPPLRGMVLGVDAAHGTRGSVPEPAPAAASTDQHARECMREAIAVLLAALDLATVESGSDARRPPGGGDFLRFLRMIEARAPAGIELHLLMDAPEARPPVTLRNWLIHQSRFRLHMTPTSGSWLKQVERWLQTLTERQLRRHRRHPAHELGLAIRHYLDTHHPVPRPFAWTRSADEMRTAVEDTGRQGARGTG